MKKILGLLIWTQKILVKEINSQLSGEKYCLIITNLINISINKISLSFRKI